MSGDIMELIRIGCARHPTDDDAAIGFIRKLIGLYVDEPVHVTSDATAGTLVLPEKVKPVDEPVVEIAETSPVPAPAAEPAIEPVSEPFGTEPAPAPETSPPASAPVSAAKPGDELRPKWRAVWVAVAEAVSSLGVYPGPNRIHDMSKVPVGSLSYIMESLERRGYLKKTGRNDWRPVRWPEDVVPVLIGEERLATTRKTPPAPSTEGGKPKRRFDHAPFDPTRVAALAADHPAITEGRTLFPTTVVDPKDSPRLLVSGVNSRKLGEKVTKGPWKGMPIFSLTLEERATCPVTCHQWASCYGNGMQFARRHRHGPDLIEGLAKELAAFDRQHTGGFVVRLHALGDFFSPAYVMAWSNWLSRYPTLHVFGYTAWQPDTEIGALIKRLRDAKWDRFAIRFSSPTRIEGGATVIRRRESGRVPEGLVCPAQSEPNVCCGSCGLCWSPVLKNDSIVFMEHGRRTGPRDKVLEAPGPKTCMEPGCRNPKQPGRETCASCLAKKMPENSRRNMVEVL